MRFIAFALLLGIILMAAPGCINPPVQNVTVQNLSFRIEPGSNPMMGDANAPITIIEFTDYQCPYCQRHAEQTVPQIVSNYVDKGKAKYYLRDYTLHKNSKAASIAARCAGEQGKYWEMHALIFQNQDEWGVLSEDAAKAKFADYALGLGMNTNSFGSCQSSAKFDSQMVLDFEQGKSYGISGTPSSVIILGKNANEEKIKAAFSKYGEYADMGLLTMAKDPDGRYVVFIKGAFPYSLFSEVLES